VSSGTRYDVECVLAEGVLAAMVAECSPRSNVVLGLRSVGGTRSKVVGSVVAGGRVGATIA
jgi:hypothetical protein